MLWLALHFPDLPLQVYAPPPDAVLAVAGTGRRPEVLAATGPARALGVAPGLSLAAATALAPGLAVQPRNPHREAETLAGAATWALQFTPEVSPAPPDALLLEIGGCLCLFGGLDRLLGRVRDGLLELGLDGVPAVAPTPEGARTLARTGLELSVPDLAELRQHIAALPLDSLDHSAETLTSLANLGMRTLGDCLALPRAGLARRFGPELPDLLDRILGLQADPRQAIALPDRFGSRLELFAPVLEVDALLFGVKRLVTELCGWLAARNAGVRRLTLALGHEHRPATPIALALVTPQRDPGHLFMLLRERLHRIDLVAGVAELALAADETAQIEPLNFSLFGEREHIREDCLNLAERLQARLGMAAVSGLSLCPEHRPELAWREVAPGAETAAADFPPRPVWLLPRPRPLATRDALPWLDGPLRLERGPERIESGWWDDAFVRRDYFLAWTAAGARLWVYRELGAAERWFLHGIFA